MNDQNKILDILRQVAGKPIDPSPEESLFESGLLDSFTLTDLVSALEDEFAIRIPDSDLSPRKFDTVARIEAYLASPLASRRPGAEPLGEAPGRVTRAAWRSPRTAPGSTRKTPGKQASAAGSTPTSPATG